MSGLRQLLTTHTRTTQLAGVGIVLAVTLLGGSLIWPRATSTNDPAPVPDPSGTVSERPSDVGGSSSSDTGPRDPGGTNPNNPDADSSGTEDIDPGANSPRSNDLPPENSPP